MKTHAGRRALYGSLCLIACGLGGCGGTGAGDSAFDAQDCLTSHASTLNSPNGILQLVVQERKDAQGVSTIGYSVRYGQDTVVPFSDLGITRADADFHAGLQLSGCSPKKVVTDEYHMLRGGFSKIKSTAYEQTLTLTNPQGQTMELRARSYDSGVAFKYRFPQRDGATAQILKEWTSMSVPVPEDGGLQIAQLYVDNPAKVDPKAQSFFVPRGNQRAFPAIGTAATNAYGYGLPLLVRTAVAQRPYWVFLHESGLTADYPASHVEANPVGGVYRLAFPSENEALSQFGSATPHKRGLPWETPWRYIVVTPTLDKIAEQTLTTDLAVPSVLKDESWIVPGKASWNWASDHASTIDFEKVKGFIDLASRMGWPYSLVDSNWDKMKDAAGQRVDIKDVAAYAKQRNVGLFLWVNSGALEQSHNTNTSTPKGVLNDPAGRREWMRSLAAVGIKGLKVDMIQTNKQDMLSYLEAILQDAADAHLMVIFHNTTAPRGWERTWPHLIGTEAAVTGGDYYGGDYSLNDQLVEMNAILPFIRTSVGSLDYSPTMIASNFNLAKPNPRRTTLAHELALPVVMESGLVAFADNASNYATLIPPAQDYLRRVPATWDETRYLGGFPAQYAVLARRKGTQWYVAGINGEVKTMSVQPDTTQADYAPPTGAVRTVQLDFSALGCNSATATTLIADGEGQQTVEVTHPPLQSLQNQTIKPFGGFVLVIEGCAARP